MFRYYGIRRAGPDSFDPGRRINRRIDRARRRLACSRPSIRSAICAPSAGVISPRAIAARRLVSTCKKSSAMSNDDRSIPRRSAGSIEARGGEGGEACGRSDRTAPARSAAGQQGRAPAAWDWGCRAARLTAHAHRCIGKEHRQVDAKGSCAREREPRRKRATTGLGHQHASRRSTRDGSIASRAVAWAAGLAAGSSRFAVRGQL